MSRKNYFKLIATELKKINAAIDRKIVRGESYGKLAAQHRQLVGRLANA